MAQKIINTNTNEIYTSMTVAGIKNGLSRQCIQQDLKREKRKYGHLIILDK